MSWVRVERPREIKGIDQTTGKVIAVLDLQVASAADLPTIGAQVENYIVAAGSIAQIVEADEPTYVTLSGDSEQWYPTQESADAQAALNASPTLNAALRRSDGDTIDLTDDEVGRIRDEVDESEQRQRFDEWGDPITEPEPEPDTEEVEEDER